jgi:hypothetical protein
MVTGVGVGRAFLGWWGGVARWAYRFRVEHSGECILQGFPNFMTLKNLKDWNFLSLHRVLKYPFPLKFHFLLLEISPI